MPEVEVFVNGVSMAVSPQATVAAAILQRGLAFRTSVTGEARTALCGMGTCYECRVTINGVQQVRSCQLLCQSGMQIVTG